MGAPGAASMPRTARERLPTHRNPGRLRWRVSLRPLTRRLHKAIESTAFARASVHAQAHRNAQRAAPRPGWGRLGPGRARHGRRARSPHGRVYGVPARAFPSPAAEPRSDRGRQQARALRAAQPVCDDPPLQESRWGTPRRCASWTVPSTSARRCTRTSRSSASSSTWGNSRPGPPAASATNSSTAWRLRCRASPTTVAPTRARRLLPPYARGRGHVARPRARARRDRAAEHRGRERHVRQDPRRRVARRLHRRLRIRAARRRHRRGRARPAADLFAAARVDPSRRTPFPTAGAGRRRATSSSASRSVAHSGHPRRRS